MPGSSTFIQVNPTLANQETDSAYAANSLTTGGISVDAILPSPWLNKFYYQQSTFTAAFCQMMANKGYTLSDASLSTLEAVLAHVLTDADVKTPLIAVTFSSTIAFDASLANGFVVSLSGNVTASSLINMQIGQIVTIVVQQNGVGGWTFATPPQIVSGHWLTVRSGANAYSVQQFQKTIAGDIVRVDTADIDFAAAIAVINSSLATINGQITSLNSSVGTLNSQVSTLNGQVSTLNGQVSTINGQITTINGQISGINSQLSVKPDAVQNVVTGSRAFSPTPFSVFITPPTIVYQNTGSKAMLVTVSGDNGGGGFEAAVYCDSSPSPTTMVAQFARVNAGSSPPLFYPGGVTFIVPAGFYYGISVSNGGTSGAPSVRTWTEWQFV